MKIAYLECYAGISGDMFLSALLDAGLEEELLRDALQRAGVEDDEVIIGKTVKKGISAHTLEVTPRVDRHHLHVKDIRDIFSGADLPEIVRERALHAFELIIQAEAAIHGVPVEKVHLHEVSGLDTVVDILGVSFGIHALKIDRIFATELHAGSGTVKISHGVVPVPAPATSRILTGAPIVVGTLPGERVTPTGAALVMTFVDSFEHPPVFTISATGYGAGKRDDGDRANVLRIQVGETRDGSDCVETLTMVETNIDDQSPEQLAYVQACLMDMDGVLDVHMIPVIMKKGRAGFLMRILCRQQKLDTVYDTLFAETSTLGVRHFPVSRKPLPRVCKEVETPYGTISVTVAGKTISPEFDDCRQAALKTGVPLRVVYQAAISAFGTPDDA